MISICQINAEKKWAPTKVEVKDRKTEVFRHGIQAEWGYKGQQTDSFIVVHPKEERKNAPLYVVLHSAGHDVWKAINCTKQIGNHDIYRSPDNFYALYLDCRANKRDWWWGGRNPLDGKSDLHKGGAELSPVEKRVIGTVKWIIQKYGIDPNRVYLCGNSMGGSGALGIGVRHGDVFAAIKANVPAGIEHVSDRMYFSLSKLPNGVKLPDPPIVIDYSGVNDHWSIRHENFAKAMNERKYPFYFYWGPFGHSNNHARILQVNDLINSFEWLNVKKNEAYAVFSNATSNNKLPVFGDRKSKDRGQVNAFFRWENISDNTEKLAMSLYLISSKELKTSFTIPNKAIADVSVRRLQSFIVKPGATINYIYGKTKGKVQVDAEGLITIKGLEITNTAHTLSLSK